MSAKQILGKKKLGEKKYWVKNICVKKGLC
jgi:hypothetical protein